LWKEAIQDGGGNPEHSITPLVATPPSFTSMAMEIRFSANVEFFFRGTVSAKGKGTICENTAGENHDAAAI
jgi:hypothetical protein